MFFKDVVFNYTDIWYNWYDRTVWNGKEKEYMVRSRTNGVVVRCNTLLRDFVNGLVNTLLNDKEVLKYIMGEVMICRGGGAGGGGGNAGKAKKLVSMIFSNTSGTHNFIVPETVDGNIYVKIIGGGGGGSYAFSRSGGGSGWFNNAVLNLPVGTVVPITIGNGGYAASINSDNGNNGGSTSFGTYLIANGGGGAWAAHGGNGGAGGFGDYGGGTGYQFGGGGAIWGRGGNGGPWGGGGSGGGHGGIYGGGGAGYNDINGGNGGTYGGGGGAGFRSKPGIGGTYGGNGGYYGNSSQNAKDGTNTIGWSNVYKDKDGIPAIGYGKAGNRGDWNYAAGGGGFGGNGGNASYGGSGGGGGYASNGYTYGLGNHNNCGGGGFLGDGGFSNGGGGGYGRTANGGYNYGGGGGYYCNGGRNCGGGGGMRGTFLVELPMSSGGGTYYNYSPYQFGQGGVVEARGFDGGCVVQYYIYEDITNSFGV